MDLRKLKTLIDLVSESNISELEITETEGKVRIVKGGTAAPITDQLKFQNIGLAAATTRWRWRALSAWMTREGSKGSSLKSPRAMAGVVAPCTSSARWWK